nr:katanin p80 WD40 repeat-containing subunit B1-like [Lepeophtheirus salmonis]
MSGYTCVETRSKTELIFSSLSGHTTPVECVRFGHTEELVCAGSQSGALKIWDLEAARLVRTLTGHKSGIKCIDFHPYGDFVSSGSTDTNLKLWDIRRKGCIFTYKGHSQMVNSLKFSPDGQWIASAGEEGDVKIWDLRAGKLMNEFHDHGGAVHDVEFHPHEFLLASASADRTVNFWDLESFNLISTTERDTGPVRAITFHPDGNILFSGSQDCLKVQNWEPNKLCDNLLMGWGKLKDIAIASTQLIGAAHQMSTVSLYVVDLKKVKPFGSSKISQPLLPSLSTNNLNNHINNNSLSNQLNLNNNMINNNNHNGNQNFRSGTTVRRSFTKERPSYQVKMSEEQCSDKSGTDPEDSDNFSQADITDYRNYEHIFRPRKRELNRTPPPPDELFLDPSECGGDLQTITATTTTLGVVIETTQQQAIVSAPAPPITATRPAELRLMSSKKASPSPTRRSGQNSNSINIIPTNTVRHRRGSSSGTPTRPASVYDTPVSYENGKTTVHMRENTPGSPVSGRNQRSTSVQPRSSNNPEYRNGEDFNSYDTNFRCNSLTRGGSGSRVSSTTDLSSAPLNPISRVQISSNTSNTNRPSATDRPNLVRRSCPPNEYSHSIPQSNSNPGTPTYEVPMNSSGGSLYSGSSNLLPEKEQLHLFQPQQEQIVPMNSDKPSGIQMDDFLPKKVNLMSLTAPCFSSTSKFSSLYERYNQPVGELSESEVTSSILNGHESMMSVLTARGRNLEIIQRMWQSKDAKTAVDQAISLRDQAVIVDLLSVITLRPSIWNLDLCTALLPSIGELLQSKYEMYINIGCGAMKLILKNFASVIKSNIDSPVQNLGVDISREERHNKCMQCYKDLVKIRSLILKKQNIAGKIGHTYRELSILMQYLD